MKVFSYCALFFTIFNQVRSYYYNYATCCTDNTYWQYIPYYQRYDYGDKIEQWPHVRFRHHHRNFKPPLQYDYYNPCWNIQITCYNVGYYRCCYDCCNRIHCYCIYPNLYLTTTTRSTETTSPITSSSQILTSTTPKITTVTRMTTTSTSAETSTPTTATTSEAPKTTTQSSSITSTTPETITQTTKLTTATATTTSEAPKTTTQSSSITSTTSETITQTTKLTTPTIFASTETSTQTTDVTIKLTTPTTLSISEASTQTISTTISTLIPERTSETTLVDGSGDDVGEGSGVDGSGEEPITMKTTTSNQPTPGAQRRRRSIDLTSDFSFNL